MTDDVAGKISAGAVFVVLGAAVVPWGDVSSCASSLACMAQTARDSMIVAGAVISVVVIGSAAISGRILRRVMVYMEDGHEVCLGIALRYTVTERKDTWVDANGNTTDKPTWMLTVYGILFAPRAGALQVRLGGQRLQGMSIKIGHVIDAKVVAHTAGPGIEMGATKMAWRLDEYWVYDVNHYLPNDERRRGINPRKYEERFLSVAWRKTLAAEAISFQGGLRLTPELNHRLRNLPDTEKSYRNGRTRIEFADGSALHIDERAVGAAIHKDYWEDSFAINVYLSHDDLRLAVSEQILVETAAEVPLPQKMTRDELQAAYSQRAVGGVHRRMLHDALDATLRGGVIPITDPAVTHELVALGYLAEAEGGLRITRLGIGELAHKGRAKQIDAIIVGE